MGVVARWGACVALCAGLGIALFTMESPATAQSALLDALSTRVTLARDGHVDVVTDERIIHSGDTVATDPTGHAIITYPDGSTALLEESSELTIEFARTSAGDYVVRMQQTLGRVWYAVTKTVASGGRYEVRSAAMASVIRAGSGSLVAVAPGGDTTVVATTGSVETSAGGISVTVPAGAATIVTAAGTPSPPEPTAALTPQATPSPNPIVAPTNATTMTRTPAPTAAAISPFEPPVSAPAPPPLGAASPKTIKASAPTATPAPRPTATERAAASAVPPTSTSKPTTAPAPAPGSSSAGKDQSGPRSDKPGQPPDITKKASVASIGR
jgi:hypothetical protein